MKLKATKKEIKEGSDKVISTGYCTVEGLMRGLSPVAYSSGINGWSCDYYDLGGGVVLSTGYDPIPAKGTTATYEMVKRYDEKAWAIIKDTVNYKDQVARLDRLRAEFLAVVAK